MIELTPEETLALVCFIKEGHGGGDPESVGWNHSPRLSCECSLFTNGWFAN